MKSELTNESIDKEQKPANHNLDDNPPISTEKETFQEAANHGCAQSK